MLRARSLLVPSCQRAGVRGGLRAFTPLVGSHDDPVGDARSGPPRVFDGKLLDMQTP